MTTRDRRFGDLVTGLTIVTAVAAVMAVPAAFSYHVHRSVSGWLWLPLAVPAGLLAALLVNWTAGRTPAPNGPARRRPFSDGTPYGTPAHVLTRGHAPDGDPVGARLPDGRHIAVSTVLATYGGTTPGMTHWRVTDALGAEWVLTQDGPGESALWWVLPWADRHEIPGVIW